MLLLLFALLILFESLLFSASEPNDRTSGARQDGSSHVRPVNDLILKPVFCHFLQLFPVRSRARSFSLIAPWLALGPSLWAAAMKPAALAAAVRPSSLPFSPLECVGQQIEFRRLMLKGFTHTFGRFR